MISILNILPKKWGEGGQLHLNLLLYMKILKKIMLQEKAPPPLMLVCACLIYHCKSEDSNFMKPGFLGNFQILIGKSGSVLQIEKTLTKSGRLACMSFHLHPTNVFQFYLFEIACIDDFMQISWCIIMQTLHMVGLHSIHHLLCC